MLSRALPIAAALVLAATTSGLAQHAPETDATPRFFAGGTLQIARPVGEFDDHIDTGFGITGHLLYALDPASGLGLRLDGGLFNYGNETYSTMLSPTIGGRITVDVNTSNNIVFFGGGPQLMIPNGRLRPYAFGTAGLAYFVTQSSLRGDNGGDSFASTTNHDDLTFAYGGGAGLYIPVRQGRLPISFDLGARFQRNGRASYLREGSIQDEPDGDISFTPIESDADLLSFHLGVSAALGKRRDGRR